ncbi:MAG: hypothetical protein J5888_07325 [Bacteroidaceae bacterium]|nr:hypothetical protein [Bacteroidaceae bacterium]
MFNLLDVAYPGRPYRPPHRPDIILDSIPPKQPVNVPAKDSIVPQDIIDSCKENVMDTVHSAINWLNGSGADGGDSTLLWTSLVVLASLSICFYFAWSYRRQLQNKKRLA